MKDQDELKQAVVRRARVLHLEHSIVGELTSYFEPGEVKDANGEMVPRPVVGVGEHRFIAVPELVVELDGIAECLFETVTSEMRGVISRAVGFAARSRTPSGLTLRPMDPTMVAQIIICVLRSQIAELGKVADERDASQG